MGRGFGEFDHRTFMNTLRSSLSAAMSLLLGTASLTLAQIDPYPRSLIQLGYDQALSGKGPQSLYAYYYYNNPAFLSTNTALRLAVAPVYFDGEMGFRQLLSPHTDVGIGIDEQRLQQNYARFARAITSRMKVSTAMAAAFRSTSIT